MAKEKTWPSKTGRFGHEKMQMITSLTAKEMIEPLVKSPSVVALRAMAEIMLNNNNKKLNALLRRQDVTDVWQRYEENRGLVEEADHEYAKELRKRLETLSCDTAYSKQSGVVL